MYSRIRRDSGLTRRDSRTMGPQGEGEGAFWGRGRVVVVSAPPALCIRQPRFLVTTPISRGP